MEAFDFLIFHSLQHLNDAEEVKTKKTLPKVL